MLTAIKLEEQYRLSIKNMKGKWLVQFSCAKYSKWNTHGITWGEIYNTQYDMYMSISLSWIVTQDSSSVFKLRGGWFGNLWGRIARYLVRFKYI